MKTSFPVAALATLGALTVLLGFFAAGDIAFVAVGFGAIFGAGLLEVKGQGGGGRVK